MSDQVEAIPGRSSLKEKNSEDLKGLSFSGKKTNPHYLNLNSEYRTPLFNALVLNTRGRIRNMNTLNTFYHHVDVITRTYIIALIVLYLETGSSYAGASTRNITN